MTTNGAQRLDANEFAVLSQKQKDKRSCLLDIPAGVHEVTTEGTGANKKVVLFKKSYVDNKGRTQIYPIAQIKGTTLGVALSALAGKSPVALDGGGFSNREGIVEEGATYDDVLDALKNNGFKFTLTHINGTVNGFHGRYGIVTK
jgi:hypothetical protein